MKFVVGVFKSRFGAERAAAELVPLGVPKDRVNILTPDVPPQRSLRSFPHKRPSRPAWVRPSAQLSAALSGHSVVVVIGDDDQQADAVRGALEDACTESIDRAREMWW